MPLATIPGLISTASNGQPAAAGTASVSQSGAYNTTKNVSNYAASAPSANSANTSALDSSKSAEKKEDSSSTSDTERDKKIKNLIAIAKKELGTVENKDTENQGPGIEKYWSATNEIGSASGYKSKFHWCAAYVSWCIKEAGLFSDEKVRPKEIAAFAYGSLSTWTDKGKVKGGNWIDQRGGAGYAIRINKPKKEDVQAGDLVIFTNSHIGIITAPFGEDGLCKSIEGNTSSDDKNANPEIVDRNGVGVYEKKRKVETIKTIVRLYPDGIPKNNDKTVLASK